jgi:radical SAM superfamily enzyme YgiQ (UPF0313 family)
MSNTIIWNSFASRDRNHSLSRPLGAHQISSWIYANGFTVEVIDFCNIIDTATLVKITEQYIGNDTVCIGVSNTFWPDDTNFVEPLWLINARKILSDKYPKLEWIIGGNKDISGKILKFKWQLFEGHSEDMIIKYLSEKTKRVNSNYKNFDIVTLGKQYMDKIGVTPEEVLPFELGRGCQFKCTFCQYPLIGKKKGTYIRDAKLVEDDLRYLHDTYGTTRFYYIDDTVNESVEKLEFLADIKSRLPFDLEWVGYLRLDLIGSNRRTIKLLEDSGLKSAHFGIESFHPIASKRVGKGWNGVHGHDFLLELKEIWGDKINWFMTLIAGLSDEPQSSVYETQRWLIDNNINTWSWMPLRINGSKNYYSSELERNYTKYGYSINDSGWYNNEWTEKQANEICLQLNTEAWKSATFSGFYLGEFSSVGYDFSTLQRTKVSEFNFNLFNQQVLNKVDQYIKLKLGGS